MCSAISQVLTHQLCETLPEARKGGHVARDAARAHLERGALGQHGLQALRQPRRVGVLAHAEAVEPLREGVAEAEDAHRLARHGVGRAGYAACLLLTEGSIDI